MCKYMTLQIFVSPKNGLPFDCSICITANGMTVSKTSHAVNNSPIGIVVSNFHAYGGHDPMEFQDIIP